MTRSAEPPLVSVITIFLNAEAFLAQAIRSVFGQTYPHWELLLIDDGSADRGTEIARGHADRDPDRVRYFEHPDHSNRGMKRLAEPRCTERPRQPARPARRRRRLAAAQAPPTGGDPREPPGCRHSVWKVPLLVRLDGASRGCPAGRHPRVRRRARDRGQTPRAAPDQLSPRRGQGPLPLGPPLPGQHDRAHRCIRGGVRRRSPALRGSGLPGQGLPQGEGLRLRGDMGSLSPAPAFVRLDGQAGRQVQRGPEILPELVGGVPDPRGYPRRGRLAGAAEGPVALRGTRPSTRPCGRAGGSTDR